MMKTTSRRNFLRGAAGSLLALPSFESLAAAAPAKSIPAQRAAWFYVPIGVVRKGFFPGEMKREIASTVGCHRKTRVFCSWALVQSSRIPTIYILRFNLNKI